jgi:hypothetical protein
LRGVRRRLRGRPGAEALRERVKAVELEAERSLMLALEAVASPVPDAGALTAVARAWGGSPASDGLARLAEMITAA